VSRRTRILLIAALWACTAGVGAAVWFVPAVAHAMDRAAWPLGVFTGAVFGWRARGRSPGGTLPLCEKLLLLLLAAFTGELIIPGLWGEAPAVAMAGVSLWLVRRHRAACDPRSEAFSPPNLASPGTYVTMTESEFTDWPDRHGVH
jgi:hypothetical protein